MMAPTATFHFRSLYRSILRASSAAVLHHSTATRTLRKSYRPVFEDAAKRLNRYSKEPIGVQEGTSIEAWMTVWNKQMDKTLAFLLDSATTTSTAHKVTRNLTLLAHYRSMQLRKAARNRQAPWNPHLPSHIYDAISSGVPMSKQEKQQAGPIIAQMLKRAEPSADPKGRPTEDDIHRVLSSSLKLAEQWSGVKLGTPRYDAQGELV